MPDVKRLQLLADHLIKGALGHPKFYYGFYNSGNRIQKYEGDPRLHHCGTVGCALGECPFVFEEWFFNRFYYPVVTGFWFDPIGSAMRFFEITDSQAKYLFMPFDSHNLGTGVKDNGLRKNATAHQVGKHIFHFSRWITDHPFLYERLP